jgi:hypothetical protein
LGVFIEKTSWPLGETKDTSPVFSVEKELADSFAIRKVMTISYLNLYFKIIDSNSTRLTSLLLNIPKRKE